MCLHMSLELQHLPLKGEENPPVTELGQIAEWEEVRKWKTAGEVGESRKLGVGQRATMWWSRGGGTGLQEPRVQWFGEDDKKEVEKQ